MQKVPGECVLTGHGYNSLRRGVEEGCEVDCGEVVEWVDVRVRRERSERPAALRLRPQPVARACQAANVIVAVQKANTSDAQCLGLRLFCRVKGLCRIIVLEADLKK